MNKLTSIICLFSGLAPVLFGGTLDFSKEVLLTPFSSFGQSAQSVPNGCRVQWDGDKKGWADYPLKRMNLCFEPFELLKFRLHCQADGKPRFNALTLCLMDARGEVFQFGAPVVCGADSTYQADFEIDARNPRRFHSYGRKADRKLDFPLRLLGISVGYPQKSGVGSLTLTRLNWQYFRRDMPNRPLYLKSFSLDFETGNPIHVLTPRNKESLKIKLLNRNEVPRGLDFSMSLNDHLGREVLTIPKKRLNFAAGEEMAIPLPPPEKYGVYTALCRIDDPEIPGESRLLTPRFAYFQPTGLMPEYDKQGFRFGIHASPANFHDPEIWEKKALAMEMVGARNLRSGFSWHREEPSPGKWNFKLDEEVFQVFDRHHIVQTNLYWAPPAWAVAEKERDYLKKTKNPLVLLPDYDAWRTYCRELFTRFRGRVRGYELWNEPDLVGPARFTPEEYAQLARIAREERDQCDPSAELLSAGFCAFARPGRGKFQENAMKLAWQYFNIHAFHGHGPFHAYVDLIEELRHLREKTGIKIPWYSHETALPSTGWSELEQAETLVKKALFAWSRGSLGYTWYNLRNSGSNPGNPEHNFGMLTIDFHPKTVYAAFNMLTGLYTDQRFVRQIENPGSAWIFQFANGRETVLAAWSGRRGSCVIPVHTDAQTAELVDLVGNRTAIPVRDGLVLLDIGNSPVSLCLPRATVCNLKAPLASADSIALERGRAGQLVLDLNNPFEREVTCRLSFEASSGLTAEPVPPVVMRPYERKRVVVKVQSSPEWLNGTDGKGWIRTGYSILDFHGTLRTDVYPERWISAESLEKPLFDLQSRHQVVGYFENDPGKVDYVWGGPRDLSVRCGLAAGKDGLEIHAAVTDDRHVPSAANRPAWQGDSLQIFFVFGTRDVWEFAFHLDPAGKTRKSCWKAPQTEDRKKVLDSMTAAVTRQGTRTDYRIRIQWKSLRLSESQARNGFRFNLLVNDNDGIGRESLIRLAPGVGTDFRTDDFVRIRIK